MPQLATFNGNKKQTKGKKKEAQDGLPVEVYSGKNKQFMWRDESGRAVLAGSTQISVVDKGRTNQDCMAVAKGHDGSIWYVVCDGLGESEHSDLASEIISQVTAQKLAEGQEFTEAVTFAAGILKNIRYELAARIAYNILAHIFENGLDMSAVTEIHELDNEIKDFSMAFEKEFELIKSIKLKQFVTHYLSDNLGKTFDFEDFWHDLSDYVKTFDSRLFLKEPATTIVAAGTWEKNGKKYIKFHNVGDSGGVLVKESKDGDLEVLYKTRPQSIVQEMEDAGVFLETIPNTVKAKDKNHLADILKRNHGCSNLILSAVDYNGIHGYEAERYKFYDASNDIVLEPDSKYILLLFSDGLSDNASLSEYVDCLRAKESATDILQSLLDYKEKKYEVAYKIWEEFHEYYEELNSFKLALNTIQKKLADLENLMDEESKKEKERLWAEKKQIDEKSIQIDEWITKHMVVGPAVHFAGMAFHSYLSVDGSHPDDTTVIARIIET